MNARAAWRLESLGFERVYRYAPGKADWRAAGLPLEGSAPREPAAVDAVRRDVPTCSLQATVGEADEQARKANLDFCLVVTAERRVLGRLRGDALRAGATRSVGDVMEEGPTTTRAGTPLEQLVSRLHDRRVARIVVTDPDGRLVGVLFREDGERVLQQSGAGAALDGPAN